MTISPALLSVAGEIIKNLAFHAEALKSILGRDKELADITGHLGLEGEPQSRSVLLAGDAGVGNARLLAELVDGWTETGRHAMVGHCLDFTDTALP